jgi:poly-gamma-glutamate synthesis protein (capsule biosynthesis protein)
MRSLARAITVLLVLFTTLSGCVKSAPLANGPPQARPAEPPKGKVAISISAGGDVLPHMPIVDAARRKDGSHDFWPCFSEIAPYLSAADLTLVNLETSIAPRSQGYSGYPRFKSPEEIIAALSRAGVDVLTTANNHSLDGGEKGLLFTLESLDKYGMAHTGTARTRAERDTPLILNVKGFSVGVLAYTYGSNGLEPLLTDEKRAYMVNYIDLWAAETDVQRARRAGADVIVACIHWGEEYERQPNSYQRYVASSLLAMGVLVVFGSHPHVLQPVELERGFVAYSLGNFISNQSHDQEKYTDTGAIVTVDIEKDLDNGTVKVTGARYTPTWVYKRVEAGRWVYSVVPVGTYMEKGIGKAAGERLHQAWEETTRLMGPGFRAVR